MGAKDYEIYLEDARVIWYNHCNQDINEFVEHGMELLFSCEHTFFNQDLNNMSNPDQGVEDIIQEGLKWYVGEYKWQSDDLFIPDNLPIEKK